MNEKREKNAGIKKERLIERKGSRQEYGDRMNKKKYNTMKEQWPTMNCGNELWEEKEM